MDMDAKIQEAITTSAIQLGYSCLRDQQRLAVFHFMMGNDVFLSLPTGSGKSLCYWILPKTFDNLYNTSGSLVIVVSPLISLMKDQVEAIRTRGMTAVYSGIASVAL